MKLQKPKERRIVYLLESAKWQYVEGFARGNFQAPL